MQTALITFNTWKKWKPEHRSQYCFRAAAMLRRRKHEFSAYLVKEAGATMGRSRCRYGRSN